MILFVIPSHCDRQRLRCVVLIVEAFEIIFVLYALSEGVSTPYSL